MVYLLQKLLSIELGRRVIILNFIIQAFDLYSSSSIILVSLWGANSQFYCWFWSLNKLGCWAFPPVLPLTWLRCVTIPLLTLPFLAGRVFERAGGTLGVRRSIPGEVHFCPDEVGEWNTGTSQRVLQICERERQPSLMENGKTELQKGGYIVTNRWRSKRLMPWIGYIFICWLSVLIYDRQLMTRLFTKLLCVLKWFNTFSLPLSINEIHIGLLS